MPEMSPRRKMLVSRDLRRHSTYTEDLAWSFLRDRRFLDLKFRRQYGVAGFVVDFYCPELRLAIEVDGSSHDGRENYDVWRQQLIQEEDISFIRVTTEELISDPACLLERIREVATARISRSARAQEPHPRPLSNDVGEGRLPVGTV
jgi:very-short-patch-repair endonuclease